MVRGAVAPLLINDASIDPRFREHPAFHQLGVRSYISVPLHRRDGSLFGVLCAFDALPAQLSPDQLILPGLLADLIAFELEAQDEQRRREAELQQAQRAATFREQFLAILGHELRNPLNTIALSAQALLQRGDLPPHHIRAVTRVVGSADRMTRMIGDITEIARARLGAGMRIAPRRMDLFELVNQVVEELKVAHADRSVSIQTTGDGRGVWDPDRMAQVLTNLVGNAIGHSPEDTLVEVALLDEGESVVAEIKNEGPPIPPERLDTIFEPFQRGAPSEDKNQAGEGLGLGLFIVKEIVLAHGGQIDVSSSAEHGTRFRVRLPRRVPAAGSMPE